MYALSTELLRDEALAEAAATLYAMNPANAFYGGAYAEAGFAYAQFAAGSLLQENKVLHGGVLFGVATAFRSNGVLCVVLVARTRRARDVSFTCATRTTRRAIAARRDT